MFGISRSVESLKSTTPVIVAGASLILSDHIKRLSVTINTSLTFDECSRNSCETSYIHVCSFRQAPWAVNHSTANAMTCEIVSYRQDYCNAFVAGMSESNLDYLNVSRTVLHRW